MKILFVLSSLALADVCVRNYEDLTPCKIYPSAYTTIVDYPNVCVRIYLEFYCRQAPQQYRHVNGENGPVCVVHYDQPGVVNYCNSVPKYYTYVAEVE